MVSGDLPAVAVEADEEAAVETAVEGATGDGVPAGRRPDDVAAGPGVLRLGLLRGRLELRAFFRAKAQLVLTVSMPFVLMVFLGEIFFTDANAKQVLVTGLIGMGIMSTAMQGLALQVAQERHDGGLKRLRGMPLPAASYFIGKTIMVLVASLGQLALLLGLGHVLYGVRVPADAAHWLAFTWVYLMSVVCCTLLGLSFSSLIPGQNGGAFVILPFVVLQFISGVFVPFSFIPHGLQGVAAAFPLKWMCQGMRSVFLSPHFASLEPTGTWEHGRVALVLGAWLLGALALCLVTFRWRARGDG